MKKMCKKCGIEKDLSEFNKHSNRKDKHNHICKLCMSEIKKKYYNLNSEYIKRRSLEYKKNNRDRQKLLYYKHKDRKDAEKYGITIEKLNELKFNNNGKCAICGHDSKLVIDHNHITLKVRGLLCKNCNSALGMFKENINTINNAIKYLTKFN